MIDTGRLSGQVMATQVRAKGPACQWFARSRDETVTMRFIFGLREGQLKKGIQSNQLICYSMFTSCEVSRWSRITVTARS